MDKRQREEQLKKGLDQLEHVNIEELTAAALSAVTGGKGTVVHDDEPLSDLFLPSPSG